MQTKKQLFKNNEHKYIKNIYNMKNTIRQALKGLKKLNTTGRQKKLLKHSKLSVIPQKFKIKETAIAHDTV